MKTLSSSQYLNKAQMERLALLVEECAEVQHIAMKIIRHGYDNHHPNATPAFTNRKMLQSELGDLLTAITLMEMKRDVEEVKPQSLAAKSKYLRYQKL